MIKTNHDCGGIVIVEDKKSFLKDEARLKSAKEKIEKHLQTNYYSLYREWHYKDIEPRVFVEELLLKEKPQNSDQSTTNTSPEVPDDYKFHCFGKQTFIQIDTDRFTNHTRTIFNEKWEKQPFIFGYPTPDYTPQKPQNLNTMLAIAQKLSEKMEVGYVRVDLYEVNCADSSQNPVIVGELTFTHGGGTEHFNPPEWDKNFGDLWKL
ncbi:ATP-grasp fold amidoligase family protein [Helicobacter sp. MIT 05-5293]|uniref:ATP-grasp fold amidoligase family protein n=1 Tax=Helicobacter sp. MIT 05-5293 TaxID=1548149 RepID=UPI001F543BFF|nr:ATP-grasp fold amidoligase family protein [Helicobacter sp. MIT 05-5293]